MSRLQLKTQILLEEHYAKPAPELQVSQWLNTDAPLSLQALRGRAVVLHAFQMLCPGCVSHGIPQAAKVFDAFPFEEVAVLGLHTVFEHHAAMAPHALQAFIHEYRIPFPVGVDATASSGEVPQTMAAYGLRGTPSLVLIDRQGRIRLHQFGRIDDLYLGAAIATLLSEESSASGLTLNEQKAGSGRTHTGCNEEGCALPTN